MVAALLFGAMQSIEFNDRCSFLLLFGDLCEYLPSHTHRYQKRNSDSSSLFVVLCCCVYLRTL